MPTEESRYSKIEAIKYLCNDKLHQTNEWNEAGMFWIVCDIVNSEYEEFTKDFLDSKIKLINEI